MLPAGTIAEIATNIAGLKLEPATAAQILAAVLAPLFRSSQTEDLLPDKPARTQRRSPPRKKRRRATKANAEPADGPRERAIAALKANPDATLTPTAQPAGVSPGTGI